MKKFIQATLIVLMTIALVKGLGRPSFIIFFSMILLIVPGVISPGEAFAGFSNSSVISIGFLFIIANTLKNSSAFKNSIHYLLVKDKGYFLQYTRLMFPISFISAFLNNTPVVASMIPLIKNWSKRNNIAASKFLIPLSYAAIVGGTCTLIGTSTNLVIHGLLVSHGYEGLAFFELTKIGIPIVILSILYFALIGHRLLPERKDPIVTFGENTREFVVVLEVDKSYPGLGKSIEDAKLRHLQGLFLFQVIRNKKVIAPVEPWEIIGVGDKLFFTGLPGTIWELQKTPGLNVLRDTFFDMKHTCLTKRKHRGIIIP
ncbi:MAG: SLC13 family permease, partial [Bacteroidota bacterium]